MNFWKTAALTASFAGVAGLGAAMAPVGHAQSARVVTPSAVEVFGFGSGRIGMAVSELEESGLKGKVAAGVVIDSVDEDSPAAKAGLKTGDIVVEFDGERVRSVRQFTRLVGETPAGRTVAAAVQRDGQRVTVNITPRESSVTRLFEGDSWRALDELRARRAPSRPVTPPGPARPSRPAPFPPSLDRFVWAGANQLGVTVQTLSDQLGDYFGVTGGVLVTSVRTDSAAAKAGVKAGDVITTINGTGVASDSDLRRQVQRIEGEDFTLTVVRDKKSMTLKGKLESPSNSRRRTTRTIL